MSSDKKIVLPKPRLPTPFLPRLPSPSSPITQTQNKFISLTPYPPTTSPIARPTYSALAHMQGISQDLNRLPTPTSPANIPRSPSMNQEFQVNPNKQVVKILEPIEEQKLNQSFNTLLEYFYIGSLPETFPQSVLEGYNQYKVLFKQDGIPSFEYTLQFSATFKLPWILSFTHKKKEVEGTAPLLLIRQFSAKWWKVIKESQADKSAVERYHNSLMPRTTSVLVSPSSSGSTMTNKEIAQRIKDYSNNESLLEKFINEIRGSPTPSENLFQDSQDPYEDENFLDM
ncbi:hypothetical protein Tco_0822217 [Tanacetum coccineum]|uniref:Reverse transcriptase domain, zinc finger, CCHC-type, aspartic peptidase domain protein n=1 Tax=Tanacetum coccineum TaxID=301880 RepID=A0ABQ5AIP7_9ASTR